MSPRKVIANVFRGLSLVWGAAVLQSGGARSLRVRDDAQEYVGISLDPVVEAPVLVHARLVDAARLVHLLRAQRLVTRVAEKIRELLPEVFLDPRRSGVVALEEAVSCVGVHVRVAWRYGRTHGLT